MDEPLFHCDYAEGVLFDDVVDSVVGNIPFKLITIPAPKPIKIVFEGQWQLEHKESPYELELVTKLTPEQATALFGPFERIGKWELDDIDEENYKEYVK